MKFCNHELPCYRPECRHTCKHGETSIVCTLCDQESIDEANFRTRFRVDPNAPIDAEDWIPEMGWDDYDE